MLAWVSPERLLQDLRYATRGLKRDPGFTATAILSLALGIGANSAIFPLLDSVLLRPLPVKQPERLVQVTSANPHQIGSSNGSSRNTYSYPLYQDLRGRNQVLSGLVCRSHRTLNLSHRGIAERVQAELVSGDFFDVLGVAPAAGRMLTIQDEREVANQPAAVLSCGYWRRRFGSDPKMAGETLLLNGRAVTIVGVASERFTGIELGTAAEVYTPITMARYLFGSDLLQERRYIWLQLIGRLKDGVTREQAQAALNPIFHRILESEVREIGPEYSDYRKQRFLQQSIDLQPGGQGVDWLRREAQLPLGILWAAVTAVLLIACANAAALQLAQAVRRQKEVAIRLALGASQWQLIRLLLTESLVLAILGGAAGLMIAWWTLNGLEAMISTWVSLGEPLGLNLRVLGFTALLSFASALLFGLAPAWQAARLDLTSVLKSEGVVLASKSRPGSRRILVVAQVALSILLLTGAGLFLRTLLNLRRIDPGFTHERLLLVSVSPRSNGYPPERSRALVEDLVERVRTLPGARSAVLARTGILSNDSSAAVYVYGYKERNDEDVVVSNNSVAPGFLAGLGLSILVGRDFSPFDTEKSPEVAIVNEAFSRYFFPNGNAVGGHFGFNSGTRRQIEIVGVVRDGAFGDLRGKGERFFFTCLNQAEISTATLHIRMDGDPDQLVPAIRREMAALDPALPLYNIKTLETQISENVAPERMLAILSGVFGIAAMVLAAAGLFGLLSFAVAQRTREIGIRMALGAAQTGVVWLVLRQTLTLVGAGLVIGLGAAVALSRYLRSMLYEVQPVDPPMMALVALLIGMVAISAALVAARRAAAVDPAVALRHE